MNQLAIANLSVANSKFESVQRSNYVYRVQGPSARVACVILTVLYDCISEIR